MILKSETYNFHRLDLTRQVGFVVTIYDEDGLRLAATTPCATRGGPKPSRQRAISWMARSKDRENNSRSGWPLSALVINGSSRAETEVSALTYHILARHYSASFPSLWAVDLGQCAKQFLRSQFNEIVRLWRQGCGDLLFSASRSYARCSLLRLLLHSGKPVRRYRTVAVAAMTSRRFCRPAIRK